MEQCNITRKKITEFLQWEDSNGHYTDERCILEGVPPMDYEEAIKYFFCVLNSDYYLKFVDNFFELNYNEAINIAKEQGFYDKTMIKFNLLVSNKSNDQKFYRSLLD